MPDLSIIIPVYNTAPAALERCFTSIYALKGITYEVLLIDDGSAPETAQFCRSYADSHQDFVCYRKENGGVSSARNLGLTHATGNYITFVDADDCIVAESFCEDLFRQDMDLIVFDMAVLQSGKRSVWNGFDATGGLIDRLDVLRRYITSHNINGPCAKLYKASLLRQNNLYFDEGFVTAEDWFFGCSVVALAKKIQYVPSVSYLYYRERGTSLSRLQRFPDTMLENVIAMYEKKKQLLQTELDKASDLPQLRSGAAALVTESLFNCAADLYLLGNQTPARKERIVEVCTQANSWLLPGAPKKTRVKSWLLTGFWLGIYPIAYLRTVYLKTKR